MLADRSKDQKDALERAAECRRKSEAAQTEDLRSDYLEMEQRWLRLAESPPIAVLTLLDDQLPRLTDEHSPRGPHGADRSMLAKIRDWYQTLSWNAGYGRGKDGRPFSCPWWVNQIVFSNGYIEGKSDRAHRSNTRRTSMQL